jgi:hypothetical protein
MVTFLSGPSRRAAAVLAVFLAASIVAVGERALRSRRDAARLPTAGAEWIWAPLGRTVEPLAFYAARDFELAAPPARAQILAAADEEYVLYLNGRRVGSGGTGSLGAGSRPPLDAYEVAPLLVPGANRLVAELRSGRGAGGFLARLADGAGRTLVATDAGWRIVRRYRPGLVRGWLPLAGPAATEREAAAVWSRPPAGRWGAPRAAAARPLFAGGFGPVVAARLDARIVPRRPGVAWVDLGREVEGYLALEVAPRSGRQVALLYLGPPAPGAPPVPCVVAPGAPLWTDVAPRRLRAFPVEGDLEVTGARVYPAGAAPLAPAPPIPADLPRRGLLGLAPPPSATPVEDEVWRELQRLSGVAPGEHLQLLLGLDGVGLGERRDLLDRPLGAH